MSQERLFKMPGAVLERPKLTKTMYTALKKHIMKEREKKKQELEQDEQLERMRKEQELRKKKEKEDSLTLEQTKEQIQNMEKKLETLKQEKHELFSQLKKVLHQEDETRKRAQIKEQQNEMLNIQQAYQTHIPVSSHSMLSMQSGRPTLYRPQQPMIPQITMKRPHSPSPPPTSVYQQYTESKMMQPTAPKQHSPYPHHTQSDYKTSSYPGHTPSSQVTYTSKPSVHTYQQQQAAVYTGNKSPGKSYPASQSAFTSYPNHYAHQQQKQIPESYPGYPRMQQPTGYMGQSHGSLQQQLEHANQKAGFNEENKYKLQQQQQIRGVAPIPAQTPQGLIHQQIQLQQQPQQKGSIVTGYSARGQAPPQSAAYQQPQQNYSPQQASQVRMSTQMTGQPMTGQPMTAQPMTGQPMTAQPMTGQPMTAQPMTGQPMTAQPMTGQPMTAQPMGGQHGGRQYF